MLKNTFHNKIRASSEFGGALIYILIAIALLAALTTTMIQPSGQSSSTQNSFKLATELNSQSRVIRSAIQDCILRYPQGDSADIAEANYTNPYPLNPTSTEFTTPDATNAVSALKCPGTSAAAGSDDYLALFSGSGEFSTFLPPQPDLMDPWVYFNGSATTLGIAFNGVYFQTQSSKSDPFIGEAMARVDELMSACEVDYTVGNGANGCATGAQCLRFWVIRKGVTGPTADGSTNPCP